jgi:hypothetical protein
VKGEHLTLRVMGLYQPVAVEEGYLASFQDGLLLLVTHPRHKPQLHPPRTKVGRCMFGAAAGEVVTGVGVNEATAYQAYERTTAYKDPLLHHTRREKMLRLKVLAYPDSRLEANGVLGGAQDVCSFEQLSTQRLENTNQRHLKFRALLTEGGTMRMELTRNQ